MTVFESLTGLAGATSTRVQSSAEFSNPAQLDADMFKPKAPPARHHMLATMQLRVPVFDK